jgi:predicted nucleic acid-binding protein
MIVADSNLVAYLLIPGPHNAEADAVFLKDSDWSAPRLWRSEFRNILSLYMRRESMSLSQAMQTMEQAERLFRTREYEVPSDAVLDAATRHSLSAYDAEFVVLAQQLDVPLVTADKGILRAIPKTAVEMVSFVSK